MVASDFQSEREAYAKLVRLLADAEECKRSFETAGMPIPETLKRILGTSNGHGKVSVPLVTIIPPHRANRPPESEEGWISVPIEEASATSLVLTSLRDEDKPLLARRVVQFVLGINPKIPRGSVNNIGTRLSGTLIKRSDEGWSLIDRKKAPLMREGFLWGPKEVFDKTELAAHRREAILHILRAFPGGLQTVQIVEQLRGCNWVHAPASKDLVKADMELLEAHDKVRKISNSRKWEVLTP